MESRSAPADVLRLLGLARRAGALAAGTQQAKRALEANAAKLVLVAGDASGVQLKKIEGLIRRGAVPHAVLGDRGTLGAAVGGPPLSAVAITDAGLAEQVLRKLVEGAPTDS